MNCERRLVFHTLESQLKINEFSYGADVVFRNVLVPLAGQREALLLKDAKNLAKTMCKQLPASRHGEAGEAVAQAFLDEAKKQGV